MRKAIFFPIHPDKDNRRNYALTLETAKALDADVILFASIPSEEEESAHDEIYLHLLQLNGFYQTHFNHWQPMPELKVKPIIKRGNWAEQVQLFLQSCPRELLFLTKW